MDSLLTSESNKALCLCSELSCCLLSCCLSHLVSGHSPGAVFHDWFEALVQTESFLGDAGSPVSDRDKNT